MANNSAPALFIIVTGLSCTGKTTLAESLTEKYKLPLFTKDRFKEMMFDDFDPTIIEQIPDCDYFKLSRSLGKISVGCLDIVMDILAGASVSAIFESNFINALFSPILIRLQEKYTHLEIVQVHLTADESVRTERFIEREKTTRHPGHRGLDLISSGQRMFKDPGPIDMITGENSVLLSFDTTNFERVDFSSLYQILNRRAGVG